MNKLLFLVLFAVLLLCFSNPQSANCQSSSNALSSSEDLELLELEEAEDFSGVLSKDSFRSSMTTSPIAITAPSSVSVVGSLLDQVQNPVKQHHLLVG